MNDNDLAALAAAVVGDGAKYLYDKTFEPLIQLADDWARGFKDAEGASKARARAAKICKALEPAMWVRQDMRARARAPR